MRENYSVNHMHNLVTFGIVWLYQPHFPVVLIYENDGSFWSRYALIGKPARVVKNALPSPLLIRARICFS